MVEHCSPLSHARHAAAAAAAPAPALILLRRVLRQIGDDECRGGARAEEVLVGELLKGREEDKR